MEVTTNSFVVDFHCLTFVSFILSFIIFLFSKDNNDFSLG